MLNKKEFEEFIRVDHVVSQLGNATIALKDYDLKPFGQLNTYSLSPQEEFDKNNHFILVIWNLIDDIFGLNQCLNCKCFEQQK